MNEKQQKILDFIKKEIKLKGYPPSVREICSETNIKSTSTVHTHLNKLEEMGFIKRNSLKNRAIEVVCDEKFEEVKNLPLVGKITAGVPILADENITDYISLPKRFTKGENNFLLKVSGDSMINAGILDNDYVIIKKQSTCENNQIVATLINNESATIKRFFEKEDKIILKPENEFLDPMEFNKNEVSIIGIVIGVIRSIKW